MKLTNLKESNEFLNSLLNNITSGIFIVDQNFKLVEVNHFCETIFNTNRNEFLGKLCGNGLGCINTVKYDTDCGTTPECKDCKIRKTINNAYEKSLTTKNSILTHYFYISNELQHKIFRYTTKKMEYSGETIVLVILEDITDIEDKRKKIKEQYKSILKMTEEIQAELDIAKNVQTGLMPPRHYVDEYLKVTTIYNPFMKISGDYYDILRIDKDKTLVFLADVTGHGISAALYTTVLKDELLTAISFYSTSSDILTYMNDRLLNILPDGYYFPALAIIIDHKNFNIEYSNSASFSPIFIKNGELIINDETDPILGLIEGIEYRAFHFKYSSGDRLYLFTDGILSIGVNRNIITIPDKYIFDFFVSNNCKPFEERINELHDYILAYQEDSKFEDDVTIIGIELTGSCKIQD